MDDRARGTVRMAPPADLASLLVSLLSVLSCEASPPASSQAEVRDSAGIRIVENPAAASGADAGIATWRVELEPLVRVGMTDGPEPYQLFRVRGAVRLSDGRLAVLNGGSEELRFFDPDGSHLVSVGGQGDGPGEFQSAVELVRTAGDTLLVWDVVRQTRSWFDPHGRFVRSETADRSRWQGLFGPDHVTNVTALLPDRSLLLRVRPARPGADLGWDRPPLGFARAGPDDLDRVDTLGWYLGREHYNVGSETRPLLRSVHFARDTHVAAGGEPMRLFIGGMERDALAEGYQIEVFGTDGQLAGLIRHAIPSRAPSDEEVERARELERSIYEASPVSHSAEYVAEQLESLPVPATVPPHGELRADSAGNLWVQEWGVVPSERLDYRVFDPEGRLRAAVRIPERLRVTEIGADYVLGIWRNEANVEFVQLHRLVRGR